MLREEAGTARFMVTGKFFQNFGIAGYSLRNAIRQLPRQRPGSERERVGWIHRQRPHKTNEGLFDAARLRERCSKVGPRRRSVRLQFGGTAKMRYGSGKSVGL